MLLLESSSDQWTGLPWLHVVRGQAVVVIGRSVMSVVLPIDLLKIIEDFAKSGKTLSDHTRPDTFLST